MTQAIEKATLSDRQLRTRLEIAQGKGFSLENATKDQLNMVYLVAQRYQLDPLTHVGLFQGRPWYTIDGRIYLARRHPQFRGLSTRPLTAEEKAAWDYRPDDLVVECTMRTRDWGDITARGKVTADGVDIEAVAFRDSTAGTDCEWHARGGGRETTRAGHTLWWRTSATT